MTFVRGVAPLITGVEVYAAVYSFQHGDLFGELVCPLAALIWAAFTVGVWWIWIRDGR